METTFSFGPSGTFSLFNAGVAYYIRKNIRFNLKEATIYTVSGGSIGISLLAHSSPEEILEKALESSKIMGSLKNYFNPYIRLEETCRQGLNSFLPDNVHEILGDRLYVGMTHFPSFHRYTQRGPFATKDDLIDALMASGYIPGFFLSLPNKSYKHFIDGGFSHEYCRRPERSVVIMVDKSSESDVSHDNEGKHHFNFLTTEEYVALFWRGVESARVDHDAIVAKLMVNGMYDGVDLPACV